MLVALAVLSLWVISTDIYHAVSHHLVWTGTDGFFIVDQMQYLAWIQSAASHLTISNLFVLRSTPADYLQPAIAISGVLTRLGLPAWLSLLAWKPVAVGSFFMACRGVVHRCLSTTFDRRAALALCVLFGSVSWIYGALGVVGDEMPMWLSWGYPFGLIAVALVLWALLRYDRARGEQRLRWGPGLLGALASSLHPWQGELLIVVVLGLELVRLPELARGRGRGPRQWLADPRLRLAAVTIVLTALPLLYYFALGHFDINWGMARDNSKHAFPLSAIALGVAPLAVVALLGYRGRSADFLELALRVWVPAALVIYVLSATALSATPLHAFNGITVPLAVLAVKGVRKSPLSRIPRARALAVLAVLVGIVPANVYTLSYAHRYTGVKPDNANYVTADERNALTYLDRARDRGGVLSQFYLGVAVPGRTGRHVFVGDCLWSEPDCVPRMMAADALFQGQLSAAASQRFVRQSGARFLLASCEQHVDLSQTLGSMVVSARRFGCAEVWEVTVPPPAAERLASAPSARTTAAAVGPSGTGGGP